MNKLLLIAIAILFTVNVRAQQTEDSPVQTPDSCLVIWHKNGTQVLFNLKTKPEITYDGDSVVIASEVTKKYHFKDIRKMTFVPKKKIIGDVNNDKTVNMTDLFRVFSIITFKSNDPLGDVNEDGTINVADIVSIVNIVDDSSNPTDDTVIVNASRKSSRIAQASTDDDRNQQSLIRIFLDNGDTYDFDAPQIERITSTTKEQTIWYDGTSRTIPVEAIDSIWYISPVLRLMTKNLDFGKVAVGNSKTMTATLTNTNDFMETYMTLGDGPFSVQASAKEIMILPGESRSVDLTFTPTDSIAYSGLFSIASNAIDGGLISMPLNGEGVAADSLETDVVTPPVDATFDILLQEDENIEDFSGFKIVNFNGEYPLDLPAMARNIRRARRAGGTYNVCSTNAAVSSAGLQLHYFTDALGNPYMYTITLPEGKPEFSFPQMGLTLLLSSPFLAPADAAEYKNTVALLKQLNSFNVYVYNLREEYNAAKNEHRVPDYSKVSTDGIFRELFKMNQDNHLSILSGMSLKDLNVTPESATFKLHNDFKRSLSIYASRLKMHEGNILVTDQEEITPTYTEVLNKLTDYLIQLQNQEFKEKKNILEPEDGLLLGMLENMFQDLITAIGNDPSYQMEVPIWLPYIMDSGKSDYWDIVWNARWDLFWDATWNSAVGLVTGDGIDKEGVRAYMQSNDASIFAKDKDMSFDFKGYDKIQLDIYGLGLLGENNWNSMSWTERGRILFMLMYGGYFDVVKPLLKTITGFEDVSERVMAKESKVDLRYESQRFWLQSLAIKLFTEFIKVPGNWTKLHDNIEKGKFQKASIDILKFVGKEMSKLPEEAENPYGGKDNECTYINLLYQVVKSSFFVDTTPAAFRQIFKAGGKALLELVGIVLETTEACEAAMDLYGGVSAVVDSKIKETFVINKYYQPYITVIEPSITYITTDADIHFSWDLNVGNNYGTNYLYDLEMAVETLSEVTWTKVLTNLTETQCNYNLAQLPNAKSARNILFRIIAHHPNNPAGIYVMTDFIQLFQNPNVPDVVTPEMVDLGLPSGTKWAVCNLGATSAYDYGNYYAWGEVNPKTSFSWKNYKYSGNTANSLTKYCTKSSYGKVDNKTILEPADDRVKSDYGYYWSIPTKEDWQELMTNCTWYRHGKGIVARGPNGSIIYFPTTGYRSGANLYDAESDGYYWSSTLDKDSPDDAWFVHLKNNKSEMNSYYRYQGRCIRPVQHKANYGAPVQ